MGKKYEQSEGANFKQSEDRSEKVFDVMFRQNRSFEVKVGRELIRFESGVLNPVFPEKYRDGIPESVVKSKEFEAQGHYFNVTERK